jgi:uncharacterized HAD superfamily protein
MTIVKSVFDLNNTIVSNLHIIRNLNINSVVGIPRSGMIPASLISTHLQLPLTDVYGFLNNNLNYKSNSFKSFNNDDKFTILLVDDTINTGKAMSSATSLLKSKFPNIKIIRFAVWKSEKTSINDIDIVCDICNNPRAFQWNLWNHNSSKNWASDLDGVICRNPTVEENDKGSNLENFYKTADPLFLYQKPIKYIITGRLEKYRSVTEYWLSKHNIKYNQLIMKQDTKVNHWEYKKDSLILHNDVSLYIESDIKQAKKIASNCSIPVWCVDNQTYYRNNK